jgi:hypothetical protein
VKCKAPAKEKHRRDIDSATTRENTNLAGLRMCGRRDVDFFGKNGTPIRV